MRITQLLLAPMELSLFGAFALLWLFSPLVPVHTYEFWACFAGVCIYFVVAAFIYEVILSWLFPAVPVGMHSLCQTRLDVRLPLRVGLCILVLCHHAWNVAGALVPKSFNFVSSDIPSLVPLKGTLLWSSADPMSRAGLMHVS